MKYTIYKVTNRANGKIYIGKHKTDNPYDDYMGSGKILKRAIEKYGLLCFEKEVLYIFDDEEKMNLMECEIVDEEFIARLDTYNLKVGGEGGFDFINQNNIPRNKMSTEQNEEIWADEEFKKRHIERLKERHKAGKYKYWPDTYSSLGKKHTKETKKKIGEANSKHQKGKGNSQFGTCWICHDENRQVKKIPKDTLERWVGMGWRKGRKLK